MDKKIMSKYTKVIPSDIDATLGWMLKYIKPNLTLLDVGCSSGYFGAFLKKEKHLSVDGIEISLDAKEASKKLDKVYSFDIEKKWPNEISKNKYDYIFIGDVLEHLIEPKKTLIELKKVSKKNSLIFISIPNIAHISARLELLQGSFEYEDTGLFDSTHLKFFTIDSIKSLIHNTGYEIIDIDYSTNDIPDAIIKKILSKIGLSASKIFFDMVGSREARAFQYKIVIKRANVKKAPLLKLSQKPEHIRDEYINDLKNQVVNIKKVADEQAKIISNKEKEIVNLKKLFGKTKFIIRKIVNKS
jgi:2-polyprenyl-3-methyl-5-hydroxy-6-metoxy-1,4-benzoquinol methylase